MRRAAASLLAFLLVLPAGDLRSAPLSGTIQGVVRLEGRPLSGVTVAFIELQSGSVVRATSGEDGGFTATAPAGEYAVTTESRAGLTVGQAPLRVVVADGRVASADVELVAVASALPQAPPAEGQTLPADPQVPAGAGFAATSGTGAQILFEPVTCFVAGEFPLLDAGIEPMASVARARVYFKSAAGTSFYYVEMGPETGRYYGKLPRPRIEASPITYYVQSTTTEFDESQTREIDAVVVTDKVECGDRKVAAFGPPGPVTVFSASSGASVLNPAGFSAAATGIAFGIVTLIATGAAVAGILGNIVAGPGTGGGGAAPPPIAIQPSPIPVPTPLPSGTPPPPVTAFR